MESYISGDRARIIEQTAEVLTEMNLKQSCSIGIVRIEGGSLSFNEAYRRADVALYQAKAKGKGTFCRDGGAM